MTGYQSLTASDLDQIAAQVVAVMDAHFHRPTRDEKSFILKLAAQRLDAPRRRRPDGSSRFMYALGEQAV